MAMEGRFVVIYVYIAGNEKRERERERERERAEGMAASLTARGRKSRPCY